MPWRILDPGKAACGQPVDLRDRIGPGAVQEQRDIRRG
jgi:hypothetical protein